MIQSFKNNCLSVYLEYYEYIQNINIHNQNHENFEIIKLVQRTSDQVNITVSNLIRKMLEQDNTNLKEFNLDEINDLLKLKISNFLIECVNFENSDNSLEHIKLCKQINVVLHQVSIFYSIQKFNKNTNLKIIESFFDFLKQKSNLIKTFDPSKYKLVIQSAIFNLIDNFLLPIVKIFYFSESNGFLNENYLDKKNKIIFLLNDLFCEILPEDKNQLSENVTNTYDNFYEKSIKPIFDILTEKYYIYLDYLMNLNLTCIKKYLSGYKDIKKFLLASAIQESSNAENPTTGATGIQKFEILVIINNNLTEIFNTIATQIPNILINTNLLHLSIKEKSKLIKKFNDHIETIITLIQSFFNDNMYILKYDSYSQEIQLLKSFLFNFITKKGIFLEYTKDLYSLLGLNKLWESKVYDEKKTKWGEFLSENLEI